MADKTETPKGPLNKAIVDTSIVSEKRREELRAQAKKKVDADKLKAAEAQVLKEMEEEERRAAGLQEEQVEVEIDLAPYCDRIVIDSKHYMQGRVYIVAASVASVMLEIMSGTWKHQAEIDGKSENFYRRSRGAHVDVNGGVTSRSILRT